MGERDFPAGSRAQGKGDSSRYMTMRIETILDS